MKHVIEAGTDAACLLLFDPGALPEDFDSRFQDNPADLFERLTKEGKAHWINTGADGNYLLHVFVDEPLQMSLQLYAKDPICIDNFPVPTGRLFFTGGEYAFRKDHAFLQPHMGGSCLVSPGAYRLTLFRMEYPEELAETRLRGQVSSLSFRLHQHMGCFVGIAVAAFIGLLASLGFMTWASWVSYVLPPLSILMLLPFVVYSLRAFRNAEMQFKIIERDYPSIVAVMESKERMLSGSVSPQEVSF